MVRFGISHTYYCSDPTHAILGKRQPPSRTSIWRTLQTFIVKLELEKPPQKRVYGLAKKNPNQMKNPINQSDAMTEISFHDFFDFLSENAPKIPSNGGKNMISSTHPLAKTSQFRVVKRSCELSHCLRLQALRCVATIKASNQW